MLSLTQKAKEVLGGLDVVLRLRGPRFSLTKVRTPGFLHFLCWALWVPDQEMP